MKTISDRLKYAADRAPNYSGLMIEGAKRIDELEKEVDLLNQRAACDDANAGHDRGQAELRENELLAVIEQMREVLPAFRPKYGAIGSRDVDVAKQISAYDKAIAIAPSSEALEVRDRIRDAALLRAAVRGNDHMQAKYIRKLAAAREAGEWTPELA